MFDRDGILGSHVDEALGGADGIGAENHALHHQVRIALEQRPVHERPRITFVGVADDVLRVALGGARELPLPAGRESCPTASAQARRENFVDDLLRGHVRQRLGDGRVAAAGDAVFEAGGVDRAAVAQDEPVLVFVEGDVLRQWYGLTVLRPAEPLNDPAADDGLLHELGSVFGSDALVEEALRIDYDSDSARAEAVTPGAHDAHAIVEVAISDLPLESFADIERAECAAPGGTDTDDNLIGGPIGELGAEALQFLERGEAPHRNCLR